MTIEVEELHRKDFEKTAEIGWLKSEIERISALWIAETRENEHLRAARVWHPIETAPKMKGILLFAVTDIGDDGKVKNWKMATGHWSTGFENDDKRTPWEWDGRQLMKYDIQPTHWQPLPEPPPCP